MTRTLYQGTKADVCYKIQYGRCSNFKRQTGGRTFFTCDTWKNENNINFYIVSAGKRVFCFAKGLRTAVKKHFGCRRDSKFR